MSPAHIAVPLQRIALVEDNPDNRMVVEVLLSDRYQLDQYEDGPSALAGMAESRPDLVLLDISLPGMDGVEVLKVLRADPALAGVPVIALTAYCTTEARQSFFSQGFDDHVQKPIVDETELFGSIERLLRDGRATESESGGARSVFPSPLNRNQT